MKVWELHPNEGLESLTREERTSPSLGPNDVRVRAASLNYRDLVVARNASKRPAGSAATVPLSDGAGEVTEVGAAVTRWRVGDRVAASFFPTRLAGELSDADHAKALGGQVDGMLAEEVVLPSSAWVRLPEAYSFEQGATLPCAGVTAWHALFEAAQVRPGDTVLVQGTGGVSMFALQLAKAAGARVIATSSSHEKRARLISLGADHVIDYTADATWGKSARAWTNGRGVDLVVDVGGPGTFDQSVEALRYGGTMSLLGILTGTAGPVNTYGVLYKTIRVAGIYVGSVAMFEAFVRALDAKGIEPIVDRVFAFDDVPAAYDHLASGAHFGKVVVRV